MKRYLMSGEHMFGFSVDRRSMFDILLDLEESIEREDKILLSFITVSKVLGYQKNAHDNSDHWRHLNLISDPFLKMISMAQGYVVHELIKPEVFVNGLIEICSENRFPVFLATDSAGSATNLRTAFCAKYPSSTCVGSSDTELGLEVLAEEIARSGARILIASMPEARLEYFLENYSRDLTNVQMVLDAGTKCENLPIEINNSQQILRRGEEAGHRTETNALATTSRVAECIRLLRVVLRERFSISPLMPGNSRS